MHVHLLWSGAHYAPLLPQPGAEKQAEAGSVLYMVL